jgi:hypothetical protein
MVRRISLRMLTLVTLVVATILTAAAADPPNPIGYPKKALGGGAGVTRIWYEAGVWHLRTSTDDSEGKKEKLFVFSGTVRCEDKLTIEPVKLEKGKGKTSDTLTPHNDGKGFDFRFATYGALDQVDFRVGEKGKTLKFKLFLNGKPMDISRVAIGADSMHPADGDFTLSANVNQKK